MGQSTFLKEKKKRKRKEKKRKEVHQRHCLLSPNILPTFKKSVFICE
jgi:hypothetical protein